MNMVYELSNWFKVCLNFEGLFLHSFEWAFHIFYHWGITDIMDNGVLIFVLSAFQSLWFCALDNKLYLCCWFYYQGGSSHQTEPPDSPGGHHWLMVLLAYCWGLTWYCWFLRITLQLPLSKSLESCLLITLTCLLSKHLKL